MENINQIFRWAGSAVLAILLIGILTNFLVVKAKKLKPYDKMEKRTIERYKPKTVLLHWVHATSFVILAITGSVIFFRLYSAQEFNTLIVMHLVAAVVFIAVPLAYSLRYPGPVVRFLKETFKWNKNDLIWIKMAPRHYFGGETNVPPPHGRINGNQKAWQLMVVLTGLFMLVTGVILWVFTTRASETAYQWILLTHAAASIILVSGFLLHFYITCFHPFFIESLTSMMDGKISALYARKNYPDMLDKTPEATPNAVPEEPMAK